MSETPMQLEAADIQKILANLPHRYPLLLVDRIRDIEGDRKAVGIKNVTINEPHFQGHFPGRPIMPGVLIVEAMAQTAGAITIMAAKSEQPSTVFFMTIDNCKFRKPVVPGDQLELHVELVKRRGPTSRFTCKGIVDGQLVAEAELMAMIGGNI
ncbi:MAG: 3-hydroxyacyl-ACP dehydratase FabZ [Phyllobacteriaceae bacterium]|nr:3-hydroxyacyl-ACP dehydratase FabZ [Phyllobacteriaceae bacterium]